MGTRTTARIPPDLAESTAEDLRNAICQQSTWPFPSGGHGAEHFDVALETICVTALRSQGATLRIWWI
jgi:hypothetical protein